MNVNVLKSMRWTLYLTGVVLIFLGIFTIFRPIESLMSIVFFMGIGFVITGFNYIVPYFSMSGEPYRPKWMLLQGMLDIVVGIVMITKIGLTSLIVPFLIGTWILLGGIFRTYVSFELRRAGLKKWWHMLISGVLLIMFSSFLFTSPLIGAWVVMLSIGISLISAGLLAILEGATIYNVS